MQPVPASSPRPSTAAPFSSCRFTARAEQAHSRQTRRTPNRRSEHCCHAAMAPACAAKSMAATRASASIVAGGSSTQTRSKHGSPSLYARHAFVLLHQFISHRGSRLSCYSHNDEHGKRKHETDLLPETLAFDWNSFTCCTNDGRRVRSQRHAALRNVRVGVALVLL
jgi:hypothetical protein